MRWTNANNIDIHQYDIVKTRVNLDSIDCDLRRVK